MQGKQFRLSGTTAYIEFGGSNQFIIKTTSDINLEADTDYWNGGQINFRIGGGKVADVQETAFRHNDDIIADGNNNGIGVFKIGGLSGATGSFTTADGKTVTVTGGIITNITP